MIDEIERLLEYVRIGPRFSNLVRRVHPSRCGASTYRLCMHSRIICALRFSQVLQTLLTCLKRKPKFGKLIILATSSSVSVLEQLEMLDAFNVSYHVPTLSFTEAITVLKALGAQNIAQVEPCLQVRSATSLSPLESCDSWS